MLEGSVFVRRHYTHVSKSSVYRTAAVSCRVVSGTRGLALRVHGFEFRFSQGLGGTRWRGWLRHYATSRKFAGSIPDGVIGILHWHNPSGRTMALGSKKPLAEWVSGIPCWGGVKTAGAWGWQPCHLHVSIVLKSGSLNMLEPSGLHRGCFSFFESRPYPFLCHCVGRRHQRSADWLFHPMFVLSLPIPSRQIPRCTSG